MRKAAKNLSAVLCRVIFIGLSVQTALGLFWVLCNFASFQEYEDSFFLEQVSRTLLCDDYTGILYPVLIRMARGIASVIPVPYYCFLYGLQLAAAFACADFFWKSMGKTRSVRIWGSLVLVTVPAALQCHLAVLPHSLAMSLLLAQLGILKKNAAEKGGAKGPQKERAAAAAAALGALWLLQVLLLPDYLWFGCLPLLAYAIQSILRLSRENLSKTMGALLVAAAFLGAAAMASDMISQPGAYGRMENTFSAALMRRTCGGYYGHYYGEWAPTLRECLTQEDVEKCISYETAISSVMRERVETVLGMPGATQLYRETIKNMLASQGGQICRDILKDLAGYGFAPIASRLCLKMAYYDSFARSNYEVMRRHTPRLTAVVSIYGAWCFSVGAVLAVLCGGIWILTQEQETGENRKKEFGAGLKSLLATGALCVWICLWQSLQGYGVMDTKNSVAVTVLWFALLCGAADNSLKNAE